ncbi:hypothetical protein SCB71_20515 [Herbiconiux sp. KACC 21604]|uniref:hypothetical protein n=1 Tax=unclassified Herbiconiux TaxID=2618217 RepID=UPI0014928089|nr:hypothetical protein [Herbiconiux sp. SALV-R1]QJU55404.1 hypothetical protein HL652_18440 [Herbiconiux sp. SALV-R1]WPO86579.1 hypothetical protein SCB71_20515 [Herbiconiux sp. KACC 21604]
MNTRSTRVVRGLGAASVAVFMAALSHVAAGGGAPAVLGLVIAGAFSMVVCVLFTARRPSLPLLAVSVALSQFAFHLLFGVGDRGGSGLSVATQRHGDHVTTTLVPDGSSAALHHHDGGAMWVAHAMAAVLTVVALRRGEFALRRLLALGRAGLAAAAAGVRALHAGLAALPGVLAHLIARADLVTRSRSSARVRTWMLGAVDPLDDLGAVFTRLRHRGPPSAHSALAAL